MPNISQEHKYWLAFSNLPGIGPKRFALLKNYFGSAEKAWSAPTDKLTKINFPEKLIAEFIKFRQEKFDPDMYYLRLCRAGVKVLFLDDENYPINLKRIDNAPFVLYIKGELKSADKNSIGVVGSRKMTVYGLAATQELVGALALSGLTIISGLARGVDSAAHKSALSAGGRTIAVLGCSLDKIYPPENLALAQKIASGYGSLVSEYPLGTPAIPGNFPARNRIISGLSLGVLVVEGTVDSGSMITATDAVNQGREVFAVPGPITSPSSQGPANLIKMGAKLVWSAQDILDELENHQYSRIDNELKQIKPESKQEELIASLLADGPLHINELVRKSGMDSGLTASTLAMMEIKGMIKNLGSMVYIRI